MSKAWLQYLTFVGSYVILFFIIEIIPFEVDFYLAVVIGALGMVFTLILLSLKKDFQGVNFYKAGLIFTILFCGITILFDKISGLTTVQRYGESIYLLNSKFY